MNSFPPLAQRFWSDAPLPPCHLLQVTNSGDVASRYSLLAFLQPPSSAAPGSPIKSLVRFGVTSLAPGEAATAQIVLEAQDVTLANEDGEWGLVKGTWKLLAGGATATFEV
jgi:hypothetical protein